MFSNHSKWRSKMIQATNSLIYCKKRIHGTSANDNGDITEGLVAYESNQMIFSFVTTADQIPMNDSPRHLWNW